MINQVSNTYAFVVNVFIWQHSKSTLDLTNCTRLQSTRWLKHVWQVRSTFLHWPSPLTIYLSKILNRMRLVLNAKFSMAQSQYGNGITQMKQSFFFIYLVLFLIMTPWLSKIKFGPRIKYCSCLNLEFNRNKIRMKRSKTTSERKEQRNEHTYRQAPSKTTLFTSFNRWNKWISKSSHSFSVSTFFMFSFTSLISRIIITTKRFVASCTLWA